jgi:hypothetical protein
MTTAMTTRDSMSMNELAAAGGELTKTGLLPDHIKTGWQFAAIAMTGREMGMEPMRAIRSLTIVKGKVTEYADSQLARFKAQGGRSEFVQLTDEVAELRLTHPNGDKHIETFTMADARVAGWDQQPNFKKFPKAMLRSRAITAGLKSVGWEGAIGTYDPGEINGDINAEPVIEESVEVRPKFQSEPGARTLGEADPLAQARLAVDKCKTIDQLDTARRRVTTKIESGEWSDEQAEVIKQLIMIKAEIIQGGE